MEIIFIRLDVLCISLVKITYDVFYVFLLMEMQDYAFFYMISKIPWVKETRVHALLCNLLN
jgi:hypothetical protein